MFDKSAVDTLKSTMPGRLPDVKQCHTRVTEWHEPAIPGDGLFVRAIDSHASYLRFCAASPPCGMRACWSVQVPDTPPGCIVPAPGFPTLYSLPISVTDKKVELNIFGFASKKPTLVTKLHLLDDQRDGGDGSRIMQPHDYGFHVKYANLEGHTAGLAGHSDAAAGAHLLGTEVFVRYPHPLQGLCVAVADAARELEWVPPAGYDGVGMPRAPGSVRERPHSNEAARDFAALAAQTKRTSLSGGQGLAICGIDIGAWRCFGGCYR